MIEINLLPHTYRRRINITAYLGELFPYIVIAAIAMVFLNLIFGLIMAKKAIDERNAQSLWEKQIPVYRKIESLKKEVNSLRAEYSSLNQLIYSDLPFSEAMFILYDKLLPNIWFKEMDFNQGRLLVKGTALDFETDAALSVKEYTERLRNSDIIKRFPLIAISSQVMKKVKDKNVVYFELEMKNEKK